MLPTFSIITVCYNAEKTLESTIKTVLAQTYPAIEYIIVDGKSKDSTLSIVQKYENQITKWISESDKGIYDAMNKGLELATGDYVWFINAGDKIRQPDTLEKMVHPKQGLPDVYYGEVMLIDEADNDIGTRSDLTTRKLPAKLDWNSMQLGLVVCHQAFIPRRTIAPSYILNNLSADIDWIIKCLKKANTITHTQSIIADYLMGGTSVQQHRQSLKDRYQVLNTHYGKFSNFTNHIKILFRAVWFRIKKIGKNRYE